MSIREREARAVAYMNKCARRRRSAIRYRQRCAKRFVQFAVPLAVAAYVIAVII